MVALSHYFHYIWVDFLGNNTTKNKRHNHDKDWDTRVIPVSYCTVGDTPSIPWRNVTQQMMHTLLASGRPLKNKAHTKHPNTSDNDGQWFARKRKMLGISHKSKNLNNKTPAISKIAHTKTYLTKATVFILQFFQLAVQGFYDSIMFIYFIQAEIEIRKRKTFY